MRTIALLLLLLLLAGLLMGLTIGQLACADHTVSYWREVLLFGKHQATRHYPIDGRDRRVLFISFRKRAFVFVFDWPEKPGVREGTAWHGCGLYERPNHDPE